MPASPDFRRNKTFADLMADTRKPKLIPETGWYRIAVTELLEGSAVGGQYLGSTLNVFNSPWANAGGSTAPPASWYLSQNGEVRFRGKITGGDEGSVVCTLPPQIRPEYAETFIVAVDGGGSATITIRTNGDMHVDAIIVF